MPPLRKAMGLGDVVLFFVLACTNFQWIALAAASGPSSIGTWLVGMFVMFVPLSIVVVYLGSHHPDEGGLYIWSKRAFGPLIGFITGWTYWASNLPYFPALLYFMAGNALYIVSGGSRFSASPVFFITMALLGLVIATVLNVYGLGVSKWLNNIGSFGRLLGTLVLIALGIVAWMKFGSATIINAATIRPGFGLKDIIFWSVIAFSWTGPEAASFMGGEIRNARRNIPVGLGIAAPAIAAIYIAGTISVLFAMTPASVDASSGVMQTISHTAVRMGWFVLAPIAGILVTVSCLGSTSAWLGAAARIPFAAGIDHYLPPAFGRMHPRWGSPVIALVTQSAIAAIFIFLGQGGTTVAGAYQVLVSTTVLITMVPFLFVFLSAIKLRGEPNSLDVVRIPGGRWTVTIAAIIGFITTVGSMVLSTIPSPDEPHKAFAVFKVIGMTVLMIGTGVAVFVAGQRKKRA
jgi:glutamate:GABA antiporter